MHSLNDIEVLIHYHCCPAPHPRLHAPAVQDAIHRFLKDGMLVWDGTNFITTSRGASWLDTLKQTPLP